MNLRDALFPSVHDASLLPSHPSSKSRRQPIALAFLRTCVRNLLATRTVLLLGALILAAGILNSSFLLPEHFGAGRSALQHTLQQTVGIWSLPPHIDSTYKLRRDSPEVKHILNRDWTRPHIFLHYARPHPVDRSTLELFIFANGINMGDFNRNMDVVGCLVGQDVYPSEALRGDVFGCQVTQPIKTGSLISLVLLHSNDIHNQVQQGVKLGVDLNGSIEEYDLLPLPHDARLHLDEAHDEHLVYINSEQRYETIGDDWDPDAEQSHPRYEVCLATQIRPFTNYLDTWIDYHTRVGVDMVYVLDNDAPEDLSKKFEGRDEVQVLYWPWRRSQVQGLTYITIAARPRCEWIMIVDVDELPMLGIGQNNELAGKQVLRRYLRRRLDSDFKQFLFQWLVMGNSGHVRTPPGPMPEIYVHRAASNQDNGKSVARTDHWWRYTTLHTFGGIPTAQAPVDKDSSKLFYPVDEDDQPITVHFHQRSFEDMIIKRRFGSACTDGKPGPNPDLELPSEVPDWVTKIDETKKYTHFRDIFRAIMKQPFELRQSLVRKSGGERCVATLYTAGERRGMLEEEFPCEDS